MEISAKFADGNVVYASDVSWINMNVLNLLQNYKAQLAGDVAELAAQANRLWEAIPDGVLFEHDAGEISEAVPPCSFWPPLAGNWTPAPDGGSKLGVTVIDGCCAYCGSGNELIRGEIPPGGPVSLSDGWLVSDWLANSDASCLFVPVSKPFVALARILEVLSRFEDLLHSVVAAVRVLLALLRSASYDHAIATSQRSFFTHHGAHPPRVQPQRTSGLFLEKAFRLHVAA
jgi:hypothetical protein